MTLEDLAAYSGEWVDACDDELSRLRRLHAAAARADVGDRRDAEHPGGVRAEVGAGSDARRRSVPRIRSTGTCSSKRRSSPSTISTPTTAIRTSRRCRSSGCCRRRTRESLCGKVDPNRASCTKAGGNAESGGDTIVLSTADRCGNMVAWVNSLYSGFGSGLTVPGYGITLHDRGGFVHARSEEPERDRAAQATVQHALRRLRHAQRQAADDRDADGRRRAGAGHRAGARRAFSIWARTCRRHRTWHASVTTQVPNVLNDGITALQSRRRTAESDGTRRALAAAALRWADSRPIMVTPDTGVYRAGSDHRKDGQAVGY